MGVFLTKKVIGPDTVLQRNKDILFNQIDGEVVMLSVENGKYYGLNKVGSRIWVLLERPITFNMIIDILQKEYKISAEQCFFETHEFFSKMATRQLIILDNIS